MIRIVRQLSRVSALTTIMLSLRVREADDASAEDIASLKVTLGHALKSDGSIDFDRLREKTTPVNLDSPENERRRVQSPLASSNHT